jgi:hypothetical protein
VVRMRFHAAPCRACPVCRACAWAKSAPRQLSVRLYVHREAIRAARHRQETAEFTAQYAARAGVEGTHEQGIRRRGLRRPREVGLAKTHLHHITTAVTLDIVRLGAWWLGAPPAKTPCLPFAALRGAVACGDLSAAFAMHICVAAVRLGEGCDQATDAFPDGRDRHGRIPEQQRALLGRLYTIA